MILRRTISSPDDDAAVVAVRKKLDLLRRRLDLASRGIADTRRKVDLFHASTAAGGLADDIAAKRQQQAALRDELNRHVLDRDEAKKGIQEAETELREARWRASREILDRVRSNGYAAAMSDYVGAALTRLAPEIAAAGRIAATRSELEAAGISIAGLPALPHAVSRLDFDLMRTQIKELVDQGLVDVKAVPAPIRKVWSL